jgi:hypothetical protein
MRRDVYAWQCFHDLSAVTGFTGSADFHHIESGQSQPSVSKPSGYHDLCFINLKPHDGTGCISIPTMYNFSSKADVKGITPLQVADNILKYADVA